jgi:hypothetical protein
MFNAWPIITHPYQHEYREAASLVVVRALLDGKNPYAMSLQPAFAYVYGILYPLLNYPISKLLGLHIVHARIMSCVYVWLTALLIFQFSYKRNRSIATAAFCTVPFFFTEFPKTTALPSDLGILLLVSSILVAYQGGFSPWSLVLSVLFSVLGFYTKPYFLVGILYIAVYLFLFESKRKGLTYFALALAAWVLSLRLIHSLLPAYLNNCLFHHINIASFFQEHVNRQLKEYSAANLALVLVALGLCVAACRRTRPGRLRLDLWHLRPPLINGVRTRLYFEVSIVTMLLLFYFKLGGHPGAWGATYLIHLVSPLLVLMVTEKFGSRLTPNWLKCVTVLALVGFMLSGAKRQSEQARQVRDFIPHIARIERAIAPMRNVLNAPFTVSIVLDQGKQIYESGQSEYFITGARDKYSKCLVYGTSIQEVHERYLLDLKRMIEAKYFDLVTASDGWQLPASLGTYYDKRAVLTYPGLLDSGPIELWERRE